MSELIVFEFPTEIGASEMDEPFINLRRKN